MKINRIGLTLTMLLALGASEPAWSQTVVKIGVAGPLTGGSARTGKDNERGVRLAIEELNARKLVIGGSTVSFDLLSEDDASDPKTGVAAAQKLVDAKVKAVIGHYNSGVSIPAAGVYNAAGIPMVTGASSNPKLTLLGYKYVFRLAANDGVMGARLAEYAYKNLGAKRVAVIDDRTAYGSGVADVFAQTARSLGMTVLPRQYTNDKAADFQAILTKIKGDGPDVIFYGGYYSQAAPLAKQAKQLGIAAPLMGGDGICSDALIKLGGDDINERAYCATGGRPLDSLPGGEKFKKAYQTAFNENVDVYAPAFYSAMMTVAEAMLKANSVEPARFAPVLADIHTDTLVGKVNFDANGDWVGAPVTIQLVKNGKLVTVSP